MRRSLKALQVDQLDLVQMHWWVVADSLSVAGLSAVDHARGRRNRGCAAVQRAQHDIVQECTAEWRCSSASMVSLSRRTHFLSSATYE